MGQYVPKGTDLSALDPILRGEKPADLPVQVRPAIRIVLNRVRLLRGQSTTQP